MSLKVPSCTKINKNIIAFRLFTELIGNFGAILSQTLIATKISDFNEFTTSKLLIEKTFLISIIVRG